MKDRRHRGNPFLYAWTMIKNRIVGHGVKPADQFLVNPHNHRRHPQFQRDVIHDLLHGVGWVTGVIENVQTGHLLDGHERVWQALDTNEDVPYILVDLTPEEEAKVLALFDASGELAEYDQQQLDELTALFDAGTDTLAVLLDELKAQAVTFNDDLDAITAPISERGERLPLARWDVPDALWPTDNEYDIPLLDITMQADAVDLPVEIYGYVARKSRMKGTWLFYTSDDRFEALWDDPTPILNSGCVNAAEPNFSCGHQMPKAMALYQIYRKRWIARYWQSQGVRVFVDLNVPDPHFELNWLGVPKGWKAYATRGYDAHIDGIREEYQSACEHAGTTSILFVVYGGGKMMKDTAKQYGWVWFDEVMTVKRNGKRE